MLRRQDRIQNTAFRLAIIMGVGYWGKKPVRHKRKDCSMIIRNGFVYQEDKCFVKKDLYVENGRIVESREQVTDTVEVEAEGLLVIPGLIDIHSHGAMGCDFSDGSAEGLKKILSYEYAHGITSYCPASMTLEKEKLLSVFRMAKGWRDGEGMSHLAGIYMEGPFLDIRKGGAHRKECILPADVDFFRKCNEACGNIIRVVTLSPGGAGECRGDGGEGIRGREESIRDRGAGVREREESIRDRGVGVREKEDDRSERETAGKKGMAFIRELHKEVVISLGHTAADYDTAKEALAAGARQVTHLFNAMMPLAHRAPGLIGAASEDQHCMAELICDGIHVHESMVRAAFKLFPGRIVLISDSMRAAGMGDGIYDLGGQQVEVKGHVAMLADGTIAGSVSNLYDCMCMAVSFGIPMGEAIAAATMNPARSIGMYDQIGSLQPGKRADIILMDENLKRVNIFQGG